MKFCKECKKRLRGDKTIPYFHGEPGTPQWHCKECGAEWMGI